MDDTATKKAKPSDAPLSETAIKKAKPSDKPVKLADGRGLYLLLRPDGGRWWRWDYRRPVTGKRNTLSLGTYPDVGLADAREKRDAARKLLAAGIDPGEQRKAVKAAGEDRAANSFEVVAREWFAKQSPTWAKSHSDKILLRLETHLFPWLGARPIADITAPDILACLRRIEDRGTLETAHRAVQNCGQIFRYAIVTSRADRNPAADLRGALAPWRPQHYPTLTDPIAIGELLRAIDGYSGGFSLKCALRLAPLVFVRPGELRKAEWAEFDFDAKDAKGKPAPVWNIPAERMKMRQPHVVPLSQQAVAILEELKPLTGGGRYLFPGGHSPRVPLSEAGMNSAFRRMGYDKATFTGHGFRAMARTLLDETLGFRVDIIEHQLAHAVKDANGRAYNRTSHLPDRHKMMQAWADHLDKLKQGGNVVPLRKKSGASR